MNLASRMRPQTLEEFVGQEQLVGEGKLIRKMIETGTLTSMIFWGPPGSGKTTLAHLIAKVSNAEFHQLSGVTSGKADLLKVVETAKEKRSVIPSEVKRSREISSPQAAQLNRSLDFARDDKKKQTILFIDEIHRWNKAQQDVLLPHVESGLITLIGATTENPSFEVISALLSRSRIFVLTGLTEENLEQIIDAALQNKDRGVGKYKKSISAEAKELLIRFSGGDARIMLNALEIAVTTFKEKKLTPEIIKEVFQTRTAGIYDKKADEHYNIISAFIKSMRGSDVDASLYYLARMMENGEDPKFIARRMIIFASEDIGLADRGALIQANAGFEAVTKIGMPEAQLILAHICTYLATAKKSRAITDALGKAKQATYDFPNEPIPLHLRNAPTKLMRNLGYAKDYSWNEGKVGPKDTLSFLPERLKKKKFFEP